MSTNNLLTKTYTVVETWNDFASALKDIHNYLDQVEADGEKLRVALDTETFLIKAARDRYDLYHSLKKIKSTKAVVKEWKALIKSQLDQGLLTDAIDLSNTPEGFQITQADYPIPEPIRNKWGWYESRIRLIQIGINPKHVDLQYLFDIEKMWDSYEGKAMADLHDIFDFYEMIGEALEPLLKRVTIIGQNLKYEYKFFFAFLKIDIPLMRDLFLMSQIRNQGDKMTHKLSALYKYYIDKEKFRTLIGYENEWKEILKVKTKHWVGEAFDNITGEKVSYDIPYEYTALELEEVDDPFGWYDRFKAEEQKSPWWNWNLTPNQHKYAAEDVRLLWPVFEKLLEEFTNWAAIYYTDMGSVLDIVKLECDFIRVVAKAELMGMPFDKNYFDTVLGPKLQAEIDEAQAGVDKDFGREIEKKITEGRGKNRIVKFIKEKISYNLGSWQQIRELTGLGKDVLETTGADDLLFFKDKHPAVKWIIQYKKALKRLGFFTSSESGYITKLGWADRIYAQFHQIGQSENTVDTGRMSGSNPNLTQVPGEKEIRKAFAAPKGKKFVIADFNQLQLRISETITHDSFLHEIFSTGRDLHAETAKSIFLLDYLPKDKTNPEHLKWRHRGKIMRFAKVFQMGLQKFMKTVFVDTDGDLDYILRGPDGEAEAKEICDRLDNTTPGLKEYREQFESKVKKLPYQLGKSLYPFRDGRPILVSMSMLGRTRIFALKPEERKDVKRNPDDYHAGVEVLYKRTGKISTWANNFNSICRKIAREAFNNEIQSTEADIFKTTCVEVDRRIVNYLLENGLHYLAACIVCFVHDELIVECDESIAEDIRKIVEDTMVEVGQRFIRTVPVLVSCQVCSTWAEKE